MNLVSELCAPDMSDEQSALKRALHETAAACKGADEKAENALREFDFDGRVVSVKEIALVGQRCRLNTSA